MMVSVYSLWWYLMVWWFDYIRQHLVVRAQQWDCSVRNADDPLDKLHFSFSHQVVVGKFDWWALFPFLLRAWLGWHESRELLIEFFWHLLYLWVIRNNKGIHLILVSTKSAQGRSFTRSLFRPHSLLRFAISFSVLVGLEEYTYPLRSFAFLWSTGSVYFLQNFSQTGDDYQRYFLHFKESRSGEMKKMTFRKRRDVLLFKIDCTAICILAFNYAITGVRKWYNLCKLIWYLRKT